MRIKSKKLTNKKYWLKNKIENNWNFTKKKKGQGKNEEKKTRTKFENKNSRLKGAIKKQKKNL
jgi:hypothetical protein